MLTTRSQWPHTIEDIRKSLDGIWGLVGATGTSGNLLRLERSLHQPLVYTVTEYEGDDEGKTVRKSVYTGEQKEEAINDFASSIGF